MRRVSLAAALSAAVVCAPLRTLAATGELPRPEDGYFQETLTIAPGVWVLGQPRFQVQPCGNVTIIEQSDGLVLVDSGGSPGEGRRVVAKVKALSPKPVKAVIITHWHGDHPQGLPEILKAWPGARTIATAATKAHLADPKTMNTPAHPDAALNAAFQKKAQGFLTFIQGNVEKATDPALKAGWERSERLFRQYAMDMDGAITVAPSEGFTDRLTIPDRAAPVEARFLGRANTDGDAVVWLPRQRILITGDTVVAPFPFGFGSYPGEWLRVIARLKAYPFTTLVPGHGPPQHDRVYLGKLAAALIDVRARVAPLARQGLPLTEVQRRISVDADAARFAGGDPWLHQWLRDYWLNPIIASAYKEAKGEPIVQSLNGG